MECLLLLGETEDAAALVDEYRMPEVTVMGWPLHLDQAELDLLSGDLTAAMLAPWSDRSDYFNDDGAHGWLAEIGAAADCGAVAPAGSGPGGPG